MLPILAEGFLANNISANFDLSIYNPFAADLLGLNSPSFDIGFDPGRDFQVANFSVESLIQNSVLRSVDSDLLGSLRPQFENVFHPLAKAGSSVAIEAPLVGDATWQMPASADGEAGRPVDDPSPSADGLFPALQQEPMPVAEALQPPVMLEVAPEMPAPVQPELPLNGLPAEPVAPEPELVLLPSELPQVEPSESTIQPPVEPADPVPPLPPTVEAPVAPTEPSEEAVVPPAVETVLSPETPAVEPSEPIQPPVTPADPVLPPSSPDPDPAPASEATVSEPPAVDPLAESRTVGGDDWLLFTRDPAIDAAWFSRTLTDAELINAATGFFDDAQISREEMIALLRNAGDGGTVTVDELTDLRTIVSNAASLKLSDATRVLANKVVNSNLANQTYQGTVLGDLVAGSSMAHLDALVSKWFSGTDRPTAAAGLTYQQAEGALFVDGASYDDIAQGQLDDCYYLAALAGAAEQDPSQITDMFTENGDGTLTVRFYRNGAADYVTVDRFLPTDSQGRLYYASKGSAISDGENELWVALAEKAYAQLNAEGWTAGPYSGIRTNSYDGIALGRGGGAIKDITGQGSTYDTLTVDDFGAIVTAYNQNQWVFLSSRSQTPDARLVSNHGYVLTGYAADRQSFTLFNPWGVEGATQNGVSKPGQVDLSMAEMATNFVGWTRTLG